MEYIKEFIKHKESKGEKAIYRVNDTRGYTYYSDDYVKWLEQQLRKHDVSGSLGFDKGYEQGYNDATREACKEIAKNYQPNDPNGLQPYAVGAFNHCTNLKAQNYE